MSRRRAKSSPSLARSRWTLRSRSTTPAQRRRARWPANRSAAHGSHPTAAQCAPKAAGHRWWSAAFGVCCENADGLRATRRLVEGCCDARCAHAIVRDLMEVEARTIRADGVDAECGCFAAIAQIVVIAEPRSGVAAVGR